MEKQRTLPIEYGIENGRQMIYSKSSTTNTTAEPLCKTEKFLRDRFNEGQALAVSPYSLYSLGFEGSQEVKSTERRRPMYNAFSNVKLQGFMYPYGVTYEHPSRPWTVNVSGYIAKPLFDPRGDRDYVLNGVGEKSAIWATTEGAAQRAWRNMQPRFEGRVSLLNSIFELKDFRDISKHLLRINFRALGDELKHIRGYVHRAETKLGLAPDSSTIRDLPKLMKNGLDTISRGLASLHLTNELAIKPTTRDAIEIMRQASKMVRLEQDAFAARGGTTNRAHASESLFETLEAKSLSQYELYVEYHRKESARYTATMEYLYSYRKRPEFAAMRKFWGLDFTAEVIWNMLPLSFVLDYGIGIADALHAMGADPNVTLDLTQYCESILYEREAGWFSVKDPRVCWLAINGEFTPGGAQRVPMTGYKYSFYDRRLAFPDRGPALPKIHWPNTSQWKNLLALVRCWV